MNTPCGWRGLSNVQCNAVGAYRVVWWRWVGAVPVCPPVSPCNGAFIIHSPRTMRVFLVWKRRYADVRAGTQAPPLWFRLGGLRAQTVDAVWVDCVWTVGFVWVDCAWVVLFVGWLVKMVHMNQHHRCCTFVSPGLATIGGYPG